MSEPPVPPVDVRTGPFQFSLKTALVVMTGTSVIVSLTSWSIDLGVLVAVPAVGVWWTVLAIRAGHRRAAYHLASALLGFATAFLTLCVFTGVLSNPASPWEWGQERFSLLASGTMAVFLCAAAMRRRVRRPGNRALFNASLGCAFLAPVVWVLLASVFEIARQVAVLVSVNRIEAIIGTVVFVGVLLGATCLVATLALPLTSWLAAGVCFILRAIHPLYPDLADEERTVLDAVVELRWEERPAALEEILARTGLTPQRAEEVLEQLVKKRVLRRPGRSGRSAAKGYRLR